MLEVWIEVPLFLSTLAYFFVRCHEMHKKCVPELERPCPSCFKAGKLCLPREMKKTERIEKEGFVEEEKNGRKSSIDMRMLEEENEQLKKQLFLYQKSIVPSVNTFDVQREETTQIQNCWVLLMFPDMSLPTTSLPDDLVILRISDTLKKILGGESSFEGKPLKSLYEDLEVPHKINWQNLYNMIDKDEESAVFRSLGPIRTVQGIYGTERHSQVFMKTEPKTAFMQIRKMWKLEDRQEAEMLQRVLPQKIDANKRPVPQVKLEELPTLEILEEGNISQNVLHNNCDISFAEFLLDGFFDSI